AGEIVLVLGKAGASLSADGDRLLVLFAFFVLVIHGEAIVGDGRRAGLLRVGIFEANGRGYQVGVFLVGRGPGLGELLPAALFHRAGVGLVVVDVVGAHLGG